MAKGYRLAVALLTLAVILGSVRACQLVRQSGQPVGEAQEDIDPGEVGLTLRDVTLEQPDETGQLLWRVKAKEVTYSPDREVAQLKEPDGELFQDGEIIHRVQADQGEIRENGKVVFLWGNIVATGVQNQAVLRGNELEWRPDEDMLVVRDRITGTHPQLRAAAQEVRVYNREARMELEGNVVANTVVKDPQAEPWLKLQADQMVWFWQQERVETDRPLRVEQFKANSITDVVTGQRGTVDLAQRIVTLNQNVALQLLEFPLQVNSDVAVWNVAQQTVQIDSPVRMIQPREQVVVTADRGQMDLGQQTVLLTQNVRAQGERNQSQLTTNRLSWNVEDQTIVAEGDVNYQQGDPAVQVTGPRAVGQLRDQTIVVSGGRVVTQILPNGTIELP
ncbi:LPS export ABC transporter periplasmic protein LptC [Pseudanabaena sp. FACHB-2040]|uniref:LPS export ABC transporter periplasmic protein LptC n=1 Tax=Pseudanabaena sp. FACHB-2040 TaxID=2692859 RepID=UPI001686802F|nr:LPS export ABC transporter periplasmic protein LptC [Pseudanabaena sp. FACHB-2040]MBD2257909.1 LPS export ABC transporter periplasmic protein LptC [Pseudanabaena sp. FACHB-2040]